MFRRYLNNDLLSSIIGSPGKSLMLDILSYKRPHGGKTVEEFIVKFLPPELETIRDEFGNHYKKIGNTETIFSCHLDTVHKTDGRQKVKHFFNMMSLGEISKCLGADNGAGIWLMLQMMKKGVPGLYIFHQGEECGCLGSKWIIENTPELLHGFKRAIAFDRQGTDEIITRMSCGQCCSDQFAKDLSDKLDMEHKLSRGFSTDTRIYKDIIPECTNVSVGMYNCHSANEALDFSYLQKLLKKVLKTDFESLVIARVPGEQEEPDELKVNKAKQDWEIFLRIFHESRSDPDKKTHVKVIFNKLIESNNPYAKKSKNAVFKQLK